MKKYFLLPCAMGIWGAAEAQENTAERGKDIMIYSVIINVIPDGINVPAVGFVNALMGSHQTAEVGFVNGCKGSLNGVQVGFINSVGGSFRGTQAGFVNSVAGSEMRGAQLSFINIAAGELQGAQIGFFNTTAGNAQGTQLSFINIAAQNLTGGSQIGFVNITARTLTGGVQAGFVNVVGGREAKAVQVGFVNAIPQTKGQAGFVNATGRLDGVQWGLVNYADTVESGLPVGLISVVKKGGYRALETWVSDVGVAQSFKIGLQKFYATLSFVYNPRFGYHYASGVGWGSIVPMRGPLFFNPEFNFFNTINSRHYGGVVNLAAAFGYRWGSVSVVAAPTLGYWYSEQPGDLNPFAGIAIHNINARSKFVLGARAGFRVQL